MIGYFVIILLAAGSVLAAALFFRHRQKQVMDGLSDMLEAAINGTFSETTFNESRQSSLENRLAQYLAASELSVRSIDVEREKIKELIADISHQTRTPLANMKLYVELLEEETLSGEGTGFLAKLCEQTEKMDFLMQSMVKMSRLETGILQIRQEKQDLSETIRRAVADVVPAAAAKEIDLFVDCPDGMMVPHDGKWTQEAVSNILDNAVKYTESGGQIHLSVERQEIFWQIAIADTGKGIAVERQAQIFTRFYREPEVHDKPGVGIGLYLARRIIELQKGYIEVRSETGKGACFRLYLPV